MAFLVRDIHREAGDCWLPREIAWPHLRRCAQGTLPVDGAMFRMVEAARRRFWSEDWAADNGVASR